MDVCKSERQGESKPGGRRLDQTGRIDVPSGMAATNFEYARRATLLRPQDFEVRFMR